MKNRNSLSFAAIAAISFCFATHAVAALNYGASVATEYGVDSAYVGGPGQGSASSTIGGATASAAFLYFSPVLSATADGSLNYAFAAASFGDWLTFSGPAGSSAPINFHVAGNWEVRTTIPGGPYVRFSLGFTPQYAGTAATFDSRRSIYSGSKQDIASGLAGTGSWTELSYTEFASASGTYSYDIAANVTYGIPYHLTLGVWTENVEAGRYAFINDPITITAPDQVIFESQAGTTYSESGPVGSVPEPGTYAVLLSGLGMLGFMARRRKWELANRT